MFYGVMINEEIFRIALIRKKIPQIALSRELRIDAAHLSRIVRGWTEPTPELKERIATALGVSKSELFVTNEQGVDKSKDGAHD